jgi:hypothetical protein
VETTPSFIDAPWLSEVSSAWLMSGAPNGSVYSMARRYRPAFITQRPSSEKATQPDSASSASSASSSPCRPRVTAPIG